MIMQTLPFYVVGLGSSMPIHRHGMVRFRKASTPVREKEHGEGSRHERWSDEGGRRNRWENTTARLYFPARTSYDKDDKGGH